MRGEAMVEVDQQPKAARLDILERGSDTSIEKEGLYKFNADQGTVSVVDGKANVSGDGKSKELKKGRELALGSTSAAKFDTKKGDELYQWSSLRSEYMAEANQESARTVYINNGGFYGSGWYWNPYFTSWAWLPGDGYFFSPFGYGFYSPGYAVYAPRGYNYPVRGGAPIHALASTNFRAPAPAFRAPVSSGFRGGVAMSRGGGRR